MKLVRVYRIRRVRNKLGNFSGSPNWKQVGVYAAWKPEPPEFQKDYAIYYDMRPEFLAHFSGLDNDT